MSTSLKQRLRQHQPTIGTWIKTPSPMVCEVLSRSSLDVVCLDAEHSPFDRGSLDQCLHALRAGDMPSLVRVPSTAAEHTLNALDCGATGIVMPHVTSAAAAESIARAAHFGAGGRGYAGSTRAAGYTTKPMGEHLKDSASQTAVIAQIEDLEALDAIDDIAAVDAIDCLFIGRIDLTVALGASSPKDSVVIDAVERICQAGQSAGRCVGMFVGNPDELPRWRQAGASFFLLSSDHGFLLEGAERLAAKFGDS
ncbi:MAG: aldolase/citrate lyase family protein [Pseudomonadota bacterium]